MDSTKRPDIGFIFFVPRGTWIFPQDFLFKIIFNGFFYKTGTIYGNFLVWYIDHPTETKEKVYSPEFFYKESKLWIKKIIGKWILSF